MEFSELLRGLLKEFRITQSDLSRSTGIPKTTISGWLNAGRLPDYNSIKILCQHFGVSADELLMSESVKEESESLWLVRAYNRAPKNVKNKVKRILSD